MKLRAWIMFFILGAIWGSSFMFIRIGVGELRPVEVVFARTAIAALGLNLVILARGIALPRSPRVWWSLFVIGVGNVAIPFQLISWGEQVVPSGVAAVLQATAALFALVVAHFAFEDERMTPRRILGLLVGFAGVVVLFSQELSSSQPFVEGLARPLAIVLASLFYAIFIAYSRKVLRGDIAPGVGAAETMLAATIVTAPFVFLADPGPTPLNTVQPDTLIAVALLGLLNTVIAYMFFYYIVRELGAARAAMVTYIVPPVGLLLGAIFLNEVVGITLVLGALLIFAGIGIVNLRLMNRGAPRPQAAGD